MIRRLPLVHLLVEPYLNVSMSTAIHVPSITLCAGVFHINGLCGGPGRANLPVSQKIPAGNSPGGEAILSWLRMIRRSTGF